MLFSDTLRFLRKYRIRSYFIRTVALMVGLCTLLSILFSALIVHFIYKADAERQDALNIENSASIAVEAESMVKSLHRSLTEIANRRIIIPLALTSDISSTVLSDAKLDFYQAHTYIDYVNTVFLYFRNHDLVLDSTSFDDHTLASCKYYSAIIYYEGNFSTSTSFTGLNSFSHLFYTDQQLYIARDFPVESVENRLGTAFFLIDKERFFKQLDATVPGSIIVRDNQNNLIYHSSSISAEYAFQLQSNPNTAGSSSLYTSSSSNLGWSFIYLANSNLFRSTIHTSMLTVLPYFFLILLLALLLSVSLALRLYKPFMDLLTRIFDSHSLSPPIPYEESPRKKAVTEFDYIYNCYEEMQQSKLHTESFISDISIEVRSRLFSDLIAGKPLPEPALQQYMARSGCHYSIHDMFKAIVFQADQSLEAAYPHLRKLGVSPVFEPDALKADHSVYSELIQIDPNTIIVILIYSRDISFAVVKKYVYQITESFSKYLQSNSIRFRSGVGRFVTPIQDLQYSYREALQNAQQKLNTTKNQPNAAEDSRLIITPEIRIREIIALIRSGEYERAIQASDRAIDLIFTSHEYSEPEKWELYKSFSSAFYDQILNDISAVDADGFPVFNLSLSDSPKDETAIQSIKAECAQAIQSYRKVLERRKNPILLAVRDYVDQNFYRGDISLTQCAEFAGTSPSYLSRLFKSTMDINFNEYLNTQRVNKSKHLLTETTITIAAVAEQCGFNSTQSFIRVFKAQTGQTPSTYRKSAQQSEGTD